MKSTVLKILKSDATKIEVDIDNKSVFVEGSVGLWYLLLENSHLDKKWNLQISYDNRKVLFADEDRIDIENWVYEYAIQEINNAYEPFTHEDRVHQESLIYKS